MILADLALTFGVLSLIAFGGMPSAMRRSANSETMMASSTSMPTARMSENSTTMLTVRPASCSPSTPARKD